MNEGEALPKGQTAPKEETTVSEPDQAAQAKSVSIQEILSSYPIDREKCRDVVLVEMSTNIRRIADSLDAITQGLVAANSHLSQISKK